MVCATNKGSDQPAHTRSLINVFASRLNKILTKHRLKFLSLKGCYTGPYEPTLVKMPHCWKSHVTAQCILAPTSASSGASEEEGLATFKERQGKFESLNTCFVTLSLIGRPLRQTFISAEPYKSLLYFGGFWPMISSNL